MDKHDNPRELSAAALCMQHDLCLVKDLMGGTNAMRLAGTRRLPQWPKEEDDAYKARLCLSTLLPAYAETVKNMTSRVFANNIELGDETPDVIKDQCNNIDLQGNNIDVFAVEWFSTALAEGLCFALVEYPDTPPNLTKQQEIDMGIRPYAVIIKAEQFLGYKTTKINGVSVLSQFRYVECIHEECGLFGTESVEQVRVLELGKWTTYRKGDAGWAVYQEGLFTPNRIPIVPFFTGRTGYMTAKPPLLELGHLNVTHWQSQSDQRNILHIARVPILAAINAQDSVNASGAAIPWEMTIGSSSAVRMNGEGADLKWVEHSGKSIEAGRQDLIDLIDEMRMAGAKLLQKEKQQNKTATQAQEEAAQEISPLETMGNAFQDAMNQLLQYFAEWQRLPEGGYVNIEGNYDADYAPEVSLPILKQMADSGFLSQETLFNEVKRRGVIMDSLEWADELERLTAQRNRIDPQVLAQLIAAANLGTISKESIYIYTTTGVVPQSTWAVEAGKIETGEEPAV